MRRPRWVIALVAFVVLGVGLVSGLTGGRPAYAGNVTAAASGFSWATGDTWNPADSRRGEGDGPSSGMVVRAAVPSADSYTMHAQCGNGGGQILATWDGTAVAVGGPNTINFGSPGCVAQGAGTGGWLLRLWVTNGAGSMVLEWKSDLLLGPLGAGCPTGAPAGYQCVYSINAGSGGSAPSPTASPTPTPSCTRDPWASDLPCVWAVNATGGSSVAPADITPITDGLTSLQASMVAGFALVLFCAGWYLFARWRRGRD